MDVKIICENCDKECVASSCEKGGYNYYKIGFPISIPDGWYFQINQEEPDNTYYFCSVECAKKTYETIYLY